MNEQHPQRPDSTTQLSPASLLMQENLGELWDPTINPATRDKALGRYSLNLQNLSDDFSKVRKIEDQEKTIKEQDEISKDAVTESLISQAFEKLITDLDAEGIFKQMNQDGWITQITMLDLDKLGQHNDLGGQAGGDSALNATNDVLKKVFSRNGGKKKDLPLGSPLPTWSEHDIQIKKAINTKKMHDIICRLGGDEFVVLSLIPKDQNENRLPKTDLLNEINRIESQFTNIYAKYTPIREAVSNKKINNDGLVIKQVPFLDGDVLAKITTTFCITRLSNVGPTQIKEAIKELNETIEAYKEGRTKLRSSGLIHVDYLDT